MTRRVVLAIALLALAVPPSAAAQAAADARASFTVGTAVAQRGQKATGVIAVPAGVDGGYNIAVAVVHGAKAGPVLAIVSGLHGTEYSSILRSTCTAATWTRACGRTRTGP